MSTDQEKRVLALVPKASGCLSLLGSLFIIMDIVRSPEKMSRTYSRLLLVMSCFDMTTSIAQGLSTWPIPVESGAMYAAGNEMTCNAQGFFTQLGVGAPMMNCSLSFYYLMVIGFPLMSQAKVRQTEWFLFGIPLSIAFSTAIMGLPLTLYNSAGLWCWVSSLPGTCGNDRNGDGDCIRGDNAWIYRWAIYYAPVWFCVLTITFNMITVTYLVFTMEWNDAKERKKNGENNSNSTMEQTTDDNNVTTEEEEEEEHEQDNVIPQKPPEETLDKTNVASQVFWQAFYYVLAFYITWIFPTVLRMQQTIEKPVPYYVVVLMAILLPLQGFFNFLVYIRPRVVSYHQNTPGQSLWSSIVFALRRTIAGMTATGEHKAALTKGELNDVETLDPCYAMQVKKSNEAAAAKERATLLRKSKPNNNNDHSNNSGGGLGGSMRHLSVDDVNDTNA